jgi:hypothetical protein
VRRRDRGKRARRLPLEGGRALKGWSLPVGYSPNKENVGEHLFTDVRCIGVVVDAGLENYSPLTLHSGYRGTPKWSRAVFRRELTVQEGSSIVRIISASSSANALAFCRVMFSSAM